MGYALSATVDRPFDETLEGVRAALVEHGFGVLTEIDLAATLKAKIGADIDPQVILGACRPALAQQALSAEPSVGLLLPCNVVVRWAGDRRTVVEALDPHMMVSLTGNDGLGAVAAEAGARLSATLASVSGG